MLSLDNVRVPNHEVPKRKETHMIPIMVFRIPIDRPTFFPNLRPLFPRLGPPLMAGPPLGTPTYQCARQNGACVFFGLGPQGKKLQGKRGLSTQQT